MPFNFSSPEYLSHHRTRKNGERMESARLAGLARLSAVHRSRRAGAGAGVLTYFAGAGAGAGVCSPPVKL